MGTQPAFVTSSWIVSRSSPTLRLDAAAQNEVLAEDRRLRDLAFRPEGAFVAVPAGAVAGEGRRQVRDAAVQSEALGLLGRVVVVRGGVLGHEERVLHAAGGQQPAAEAAQPAQVFRLVVPGSDEPGRALPAEGAPVVLAATDVHGAVDQDVEAEPGAGAELQHAHAPLHAVAALDQAHPGDLLQPADALHQLLARELPSPESWHETAPPCCPAYPICIAATSADHNRLSSSANVAASRDGAGCLTVA